MPEEREGAAERGGVGGGLSRLPWWNRQGKGLEALDLFFFQAGMVWLCAYSFELVIVRACVRARVLHGMLLFDILSDYSV